MQWQPIETAPKDGRPVLLRGGRVGDRETPDVTPMALAYWHTYAQPFWSPQRPAASVWLITHANYCCEELDYRDPTEWASVSDKD